MLKCKYVCAFSFTQMNVDYMIKADYVADISKVDTREILEEYRMFSERTYSTITEAFAKLLTELQPNLRQKFRSAHPEYGTYADKTFVQIQFNKVLGVRYI